MRLMTLNLRHGGGARVPAIAAWIVRQAPDLAVLTEYRANAAGVKLRELLEAQDYAVTGASRGPGANGVLVASRLPIETIERATPSASPSGELLLVRAAGLAVLGCYFPQGKAKAPFFGRCGDLADAISTPLILLGDLNTGCNLRDLAPGAARFDCADRFLDLERMHGLADLWRATHGPEAREWTWLSRVSNGYRLDHAFANRAFLEAGACETLYMHETREGGLSDHSALVVALNPVTGW